MRRGLIFAEIFRSPLLLLLQTPIAGRVAVLTAHPLLLLARRPACWMCRPSACEFNTRASLGLLTVKDMLRCHGHCVSAIGAYTTTCLAPGLWLFPTCSANVHASSASQDLERLTSEPLQYCDIRPTDTADFNVPW